MTERHLQHFFNCTVPIFDCNLHCRYCFVTQAHLAEGRETVRLDADLLAQSLSVKRAGLSLVNLCGHGETLLHPDIVPVVRELLAAGQFVAVVTNCTVTKRVEELCALPAGMRERLFLKASFHYEELHRRKMLDRYFGNIFRLRQAGISYSIEIVASDSLAPMVPDIISLFQERGEPLPQVLESRESISGSIGRLTELSISEHTALWSQFHSPLFDGMQALWGVRRREFCYAGEYSVAVNLASGEMIQCNERRALQNIYQNLDEPLYFCAVGRNCQLTHCYISYVWQGLCGNVRGLKFPSYDSQRNRIMSDGSEWLSPAVKRAYSEMIGRKAGYYSKRKEHIVSALMDAQYRGVEAVCTEDRTVLESWLAELFPIGSRIAVYGMGEIGRLLARLVEGIQERELLAVIDRNRPSDCETADWVWFCPDEAMGIRLVEKGVTDVLVTPFVDGLRLAKRLRENQPALHTTVLMAALSVLR